MIDGRSYIKKIELYYFFLELEFGFSKANEVINGNAFYDVEYKNAEDEKIISISYENIEEHLEVIIFRLLDGKMPNYDDKSQTLHLNQLNRLIISRVNKEDINSNAEYFLKYTAENKIDKKLLKGAKELRLCLKHFDLFTNITKSLYEK